LIVRYIEIIAEVPANEAERTADILRAVTECGLWIEATFAQTDLESDAIVSLNGRHRVHAYLPADGDRGGVVLEARDKIDAARIPADIETRVVVDEDWAEAWKEHFHIERYGERLVVVPSWRQYAPQEGEAVLVLDPGMAFGTGQHETTRMCLEALERRIEPGVRMLDVGCGSGILAIAAAKLGARDIHAVDVDPVCVAVAQANAALNGVDVAVASGSLGDRWPFSVPARSFDIVAANIIANPLIEMAPDFAEALAHGGRLIASGVIASREAVVAAAFAAAGLRIMDVRPMGEWRCMEAVAP
jgi:ribosomal protein L11 methyltransferase